jgi:hypothetical protein
MPDSMEKAVHIAVTAENAVNTKLRDPMRPVFATV